MKKQFITKSNVQNIFNQVKSLLNDYDVKITEWDICSYTIDDHKQYMLSMSAKGKFLTADFNDTENGLKNIEYSTMVGAIDYICKTTDIDNVVNAIAREFAPIAENLNGKTVGYWFYTTPMLPEEHFQVHVELTDENNNYISTITVNRVNGEIQVNDRISYEDRVFDRKINEREEKFAVEVAKKAFAANEKWINNELATQKFHGMDEGFEVIEMSESNLNVVEEKEIKIGTVEVIGKNFRGSNIVRKLIKIDRNKTKHWIVWNRTCERCGGVGGSDVWKFSGWTCFRCEGTGVDPDAQEQKEYTPEYRAKLDERNQIKREKHHQEIVEQSKIELAKTYPDHKIYIVLGDTFKIKDQIKADGGRFNNVHHWFFSKPVEGYKLHAVDLFDAYEFNNDGLPCYDKPKPVELPKEESDHQSEWVGSIKDRLTLKVKLNHRHEYERQCFNVGGFRGEYYGRQTETAYIYTFEDEAGNKFVWNTGSIMGEFINKDQDQKSWRSCKNGDVLEIKATVKKHGEYKGEKQTELQRVNIIRRIA